MTKKVEQIIRSVLLNENTEQKFHHTALVASFNDDPEGGDRLIDDTLENHHHDLGIVTAPSHLNGDELHSYLAQHVNRKKDRDMVSSSLDWSCLVKRRKRSNPVRKTNEVT